VSRGILLDRPPGEKYKGAGRGGTPALPRRGTAPEGDAMKDNSVTELAARCLSAMGGEGEAARRGKLFSSLAEIFGSLAAREDFARLYPAFLTLFAACRESILRADAEAIEESITMAYAWLHGADSAYAPREREELDGAGGYWCHAGGLSPLWRAERWIPPRTRLVDYGAGNGLQGLLFQRLYPHRRTTLIELSGDMISRGKALQSMMGIDPEKVEWIHGSVTEVPPDRFDFIYLYRPLRPEGKAGRLFYENFAGTLAGVSHGVTIFSIADCLRDFLDASFVSFYDDGQLACFTNGPGG